jgi:hypothetical protein
MAEKILYLECKSGISGDMAVAALLDLGADEKKLTDALNSLNLHDTTYCTRKVNKCGILALDFDVKFPHHHHHDEHHAHRNLKDIYEIIDKGDLTPKTRSLAKKIFEILARAEAKAHGESIENVHFHEVGAYDSIVDVIAVAFCVENLGVDEVVTSALCEGQGFVTCQHGRLPVPVPAVVNIAAEYKIPLEITEFQGEMVTPTGIAIVAALESGKCLPKKFTIQKIGHGAGKREMAHPNILRAMLIEEVSTQNSRETQKKILLLETNIDDSTGEQLGFAMETLLAQGARDVHYIPAFAKKNRPAWILRVITDFENAAKMEEIIFKTTTTVGIRRLALERVELSREIIDLTLPFGVVKVKKCTFEGNVFYYPEYESVKALATEGFADFQTIYKQAQAEMEGK